MPGYRDYAIVGPPYEAVFSAVDQVTPPIYSRRVLIFSRQHDDYEQAVLALRAGLQQTVDQVPILAGQMGLDSKGWTVKKGHARLRVQELDMTFEDLQNARFSEELLPADAISSVPGLADPQTEWHVCRVQANFIRGGLLLVISINHTVMDGYGITKVTEALARNSCMSSSASPPSKLISVDRARLSQFESETETRPNAKLLGAYSIVREASKLPPVSGNTVTTTFQIPVAALKALKDAATPAEGWITTHDAVNALCWRTHAQARHHAGLITLSDTARFAFPVDFRKLIRPSLSSDYVGNAVLMTIVELPVKTLLGAEGLSQAAAAIRAGVKNVDAEYVENFIAVASSLEKPGQLKINLKLEHPDTGFGSTSYKSFAHDSLDWDPAVGKFERFRLSWGVTGEGMSVILPTLEDGSWEVTVTVKEEQLAAFKTDKTWKEYTQ